MSNEQGPKASPTKTPAPKAATPAQSGNAQPGTAQAAAKGALVGRGFDAQAAMLSPLGGGEAGDGGRPGDRRASSDPFAAAARGASAPLPFLAELEASFGTSLRHLKVVLGQKSILAGLGAKALTRGDTLVFAETSPSLELVAEEVAHALQRPAGTGAKAWSNNADGSEVRAKDAARKVAQGQSVEPEAVGAADARTQAGWIGSGLNAVGNFFGNAYTNVKETFTGGSKNTDFTPDQWRAKHLAFLDRYGAKGKNEDDAVCTPTLNRSSWFGTYFVYERLAYQRGLDTWSMGVSKLQQEAAMLEQMAGNLPGLARSWMAPAEVETLDRKMPSWEEFAPQATRDGIPVLKEEAFEELRQAMDASRTELESEIAACIEKTHQANKGAVEAVTAVKQLLAGLKGAPVEEGAPGPAHIPAPAERKLRAFYSFYSATGEGYPLIYNHPIFKGSPDQVLALAALLSPLEDLKLTLRAAANDKPRCLGIVRDWARQHPDLGTQALSDPEIEQLIYTAGGAAALEQRTKAVGVGTGALGVMSLSPVTTAGGMGMFALGGMLGENSATLDGDTLEMVKLLQNGGHIEGSDAEAKAKSALVEGDEDAFLRAWAQIVHKPEAFERLTKDDGFRQSVRTSVPGAWDYFLSTVKAGSIESNTEVGLDDKEKKLVEQLSNPCVRDLADALNPALYTRWTHRGGVRDASVVNPLQSWNQQISNALAADTETTLAKKAWDGKLREARFILCKVFQARQGTPLAAELHRGLSGKSLETALELIGETGSQQALTVLGYGDSKLDQSGKDTLDKYGEELSDEERRALKFGVFLDVAGKLYFEMEKYSVFGAAGGGTSGAGVIGLLEGARAEARRRLQPPDVDKKPELQKAFSKKVTQAMVYLAEVYNDAYEAEGEGKGSLRLRLTRELSPGHQRRALDLIAAAPAPTQHLVDGAMAQINQEAKTGGVTGILANAQSSTIEAGLDALQQHAATYANKLFETLPPQAAGSKLETLRGVATQFQTGMPAEARSALAARPSLDKLPWQMIEAAFKPLGGSLGGAIVEGLKGRRDDAQAALDAFRLGPIGRYIVAADAELMASLAKLEADDAALADKQKNPKENKKEVAAARKDNAELRAKIQKQMPEKQQLAHLSGELFKTLEKAPVDQDAAVALAGEMAKVPGHLDAPVEVVDPNRLGEGQAPVRVLQGQRLDAFVYKQYQGIALALHLGRKLDREHAVKVEERLGIRIDAAGAPKEQLELLNDRSKLEAFADKLKIDNTRVHGNIGKGAGDDDKGWDDKTHGGKQAWEQSESFIHQAAATVRDLHERIERVGAFFKMMQQRGNHGEQGPAIGIDLYVDAKRELVIALGGLGTGEERRVVDALYEEVYGASLKFQLTQLNNLTGEQDVEGTRRLAEGRLTAIDHIRAMVAAGDKESVYQQIFKASKEVKRAIVGDEALLRLISTKLGADFLQNTIRVCEGTSSLADLFMERDAQGGGGNALSRFAASQGWRTDEAGMKEDVKRHLTALKAQILEAKRAWVVAKGESLWMISELAVGAGVRWTELWDANKTVVKKDPNLIHTNVKLQLPAEWVKNQVAEELGRQYLKIVLDPDVRSFMGEQLTASERFEIEALITGGGEISAGNQAVIELEAGKGPALVAALKKLDAGQRQDLLNDQAFVAKMMSQLNGAEYEQAMTILRAGAEYDKFADLIGGLSGTDFGKLDTIDESKIFDALAALGPDELRRLAQSPILAARVQKFLDNRGDEGALFDQYIESATEDHATGSTPAEQRESMLKQRREHLVIKYTIRFRRALSEGRDKLLALAQEVFKERGEIEVPVVEAAPGGKKSGKQAAPAEPKKETVKCFRKEVERKSLWDSVGAEVRSKESGLAGMIEGAVLGTRDPSIDRIEHALSSTLGMGKEVDAAKAAIEGAADITVAKEWSNIVKPDVNGNTLKQYYEAFVFWRDKVEAVDNEIKGIKSKTKLAEAHARRDQVLAEFYRRYTEFKGFRLDLNKDMRGVVAKEGKIGGLTGWLNSVGAKDQLALREAIRARIGKLPKNVVGQAIGIVDEDGALLGADGKPAKDPKSGEAAKTAKMAITEKVDFQAGTKTAVAPPKVHDKEGKESAYQGKVGLSDLDLLMSDDRAARMGDVSAAEKYDHTRGDGFFGKSFAGGDLDKAAMNVAYYNSMLDQAEERKETEEVSTVDADEKAALAEQLARIGKNLTDYAATKKWYADIIKNVVVAVIAAVSTALTGGAAAPLWAVMLEAAVTAGAKVAIDELILGNDYEALAEGIPMIISDTVKAGLEQSLAAGLKSFAQQKNVFAKGVKWKTDTEEWLKAYIKKAGPLEGAMLEALQTGFGEVTNAALDPVTRFLAPETWAEVYKYGLTSTWNQSVIGLDKKIQTMPGDFLTTVGKTFLTKYASRQFDKVMTKKDDSPKGLPGLAITKTRPPAPALWDSIAGKLQGQLGTGDGSISKATYEFIVKQLISEGFASLKPGHQFGDSWTEEGVMKLLQTYGTDRLKGLISAIGKGAGEHKKVTTALARTEEESARLKDLAAKYHLDHEQMKDYYYHFITSGLGEESTGKLADLWSEMNNHGGMSGITSAEFEKFFLGPRLDKVTAAEKTYRESCKTKNVPVDDHVIRSYREWVFAKPGEVDSRAELDITKFAENSKKLEAAGFQTHILKNMANLTGDQIAFLIDWASDPTRVGDVTKGELSTVKINEAYLVSKQTLALGNADGALSDKQRAGEFAAWLKKQDASFWNKDELRFGPSDSNIAAKVKLMAAQFEKEVPAKSAGKSGTKTTPTTHGTKVTTSGGAGTPPSNQSFI